MEQEPVPKHQRVPVPQSIQAEVVNACMRRCCLCYYLHDERRVRKGQIAHLNRNRSDPDFPNLVFLCLEHHDEFDSQTSQSKGLIPQEVKVYRDRLYRELDRPSSTSKQKIAPPPAAPAPLFRITGPTMVRLVERMQFSRQAVPLIEYTAPPKAAPSDPPT